MAQVSRSSVVQAQYNQIPQYTLGKCNQGTFDHHLRHLSQFLEEMASSKIGSWWSRSSSEWSNSVIGRRSLPELGISPHHTLIISSCTTWRSPTVRPTGDQPTNRGAKTQNFPDGNFLAQKISGWSATNLKSACLPITTLPKMRIQWAKLWFMHRI